MKKRIVFLALAMALCLGLCGCFEPAQPELDEDGHETPLTDMTVVSDGSLSAVVVEKADDGITLEVTNSGSDSSISATFTSVKISGHEYTLNQSTYADSPVSIIRSGSDSKTVNLKLSANDFARMKVSSSELSSSDDYNNVDLTYSETYMSNNGTVTKTGRTISIKNA